MMAVPRRLEVPVRVRFEECQPGGAIRASSLLRYAQDIAWVHSETAGFDRAWYAERDLAWLVRSQTLEVVGAGGFGRTILVATEVTAIRRVLARRRTEIHESTGELLATVETDWLMTAGGLTPTRVPAEIESTFPAVEATFEPARVQLPNTPPDAHRRAFHVRRSEVDPMAHVNNAVYLDYLEEALAEVGAADALAIRPRHYRLEYQRAAEPGAELSGAAWADGAGWAYRLTDGSGADLLRARFMAG